MPIVSDNRVELLEVRASFVLRRQGHLLLMSLKLTVPQPQLVARRTSRDQVPIAKTRLHLEVGKKEEQ